MPATATSGWTSAGKFGKALVFDGSDDYVNLGTSSNLDVFGGDSTVSLWAKWTDARVGTQYGILTIGTFTNKFVLGLGYNNPATLSLRIGAGTGVWDLDIGPGSLNNGNWHHIVITKSGSTITPYVDKIPYSYAPGGGLAIANTNYIGSGNYGNLSGSVDEVKIYNYALTADEVKLDYNRGSSIVLGSLSDNSTYAKDAAHHEYWVPG